MKEAKSRYKTNSVPDFVRQSIGLFFGTVGELQRQVYAQAIMSLGITDQQLFILVALENLGPQVQAHLSEPLQIDKATMVGLINGLESKGLVQRLPHPVDRRAVLVQLTEAGREVMGKGFELSAEFTRKSFKGVSPEEQQIFQEVLEKLAANTLEIAQAMNPD
jgi:DNA-binding MarR family transcriptional regulator